MYTAPLKEIQFVLAELLRIDRLENVLAECSHEFVGTVLTHAARFAENVIAPFNASGDREGAHVTAEGVVTANGFKAAYRQFVADGWSQLGSDPDYGGQPAPHVLTTAVHELWASANVSFELCPMLTKAVCDALTRHGTGSQKDTFLRKMILGEWTGTMVLTEPHAGSDLSLIRTRAVPEGDCYRLFGQKIFITWGDHDLTENIVHLVLARIEGAPAGTRGLSLFIVPKRLLTSDGGAGKPNAVQCVSIEHKLGIHASPTCLLQFGEGDTGATGYLLGEVNCGLEYMFTVMNAARLAVGLQGYALAEQALQRATAWAQARVQGKALEASKSAPAVTIIHHPDVKRMLLTMRSCTEAARALTLYAAFQLDLAAHGEDSAKRDAQHRAELLIPIVKGWCTELGVEIAEIGIQVHGGMGYVEETGAAQSLRDVRITTIYEGTTGIQANDLVHRKLARDGGATMRSFIATMRSETQALSALDAIGTERDAVLEVLLLLDEATTVVLDHLSQRPAHAAAIAVPYMHLCGFAAAAWLMTKAAAIAADKRGGAADPFYESKLHTVRFFSGHVLPRALGLARSIVRGAATIVDVSPALI